MATKKQASGAKKRASKAGRPSSSGPKGAQLLRRGQPTAFGSELIPLVRILCEKGATDEELAVALNVNRTTIHNWKRDHPDFFNTVKEAKAEADDAVEKALFARAMGYSHPSEEIHFTKDGQVLRAATVKQYPPDATSLIFWLKNRRPEQWRDKQEMEHSAGASLADLVAASWKVSG